MTIKNIQDRLGEIQSIPPSNSVERFLTHRTTPAIIIGFFSLFLLVWSFLDHTVPAHDPAWHSYSSTEVKHWLSHPKNWSLMSLTQILTMNYNYPGGVWFLNGLLKFIVGISHQSEHLILCFYLILLSVATHKMATLFWQDRLAANLAIIFLNCSPIILLLTHIPYLDLPFACLYSWFIVSFVVWTRDRTWRKSLLLALLLSLCCISKQIASLYCLPLMAIALIYSIKKKDLLASAQVLVSLLLCSLFLCSWVLPNWHDLTNYQHNRSAFAASTKGVGSSFLSSLEQTLACIAQGISPLSCVFLALVCTRLKKSCFKPAWPLFFSAIAGCLLMMLVAFYNNPETRYFAPAAITLSLLSSYSAANLLRFSSQGRIVVALYVVLLLIQGLWLCFFQPSRAPVSTFRQVQASTAYSPLSLPFGTLDTGLSIYLRYLDGSDPWKQIWLIEQVEKRSNERFCNLFTLSNTIPYNKGSLLYLCSVRHNKIKAEAWTRPGPDMSDLFNYDDLTLSAAQWVLRRTGEENSAPFFDNESRKNYRQILTILEDKKRFAEVERANLPDRTELVLYHNKYYE